MLPLPHPTIPTSSGQRQRNGISKGGHRWHRLDLLKIREGMHNAQVKIRTAKEGLRSVEEEER